MLPDNFEYEKMSDIGEFFTLLDDLNSRYETDLEVYESAKWKHGTYNKIKKVIAEVTFPQWNRKRGANRIWKLFDRQRWRLENFQESITRLDRKLAKYRYNGINLKNEESIEEGKTFVKLIQDSIENIKNPNISAEITNEPWFTQKDNNSMPHQYIGSFPQVDVDGNIDRLLYSNGLVNVNEINPANWYLNIKFDLRNIILEASTDRTSAKIPFGDMYVLFTFPFTILYQANCSKYITSNASDSIKQWSYVYPYFDGARHPFVSTSGNRRYKKQPNSYGQLRTYSMGNTCFGDLHSDIIKLISSGRFDEALLFLNQWASCYPLTGTSPLNQINTSMIGLDINFPQEIKERILCDTFVCDENADLLLEQGDVGLNDQYIADNCLKCISLDTCRVLRNKLMWSNLQVDYIDKELSKEDRELLRKYYDNNLIYGNQHNSDSLYNGFEKGYAILRNGLRNGRFDLASIRHIFNDIARRSTLEDQETSIIKKSYLSNLLSDENLSILGAGNYSVETFTAIVLELNEKDIMNSLATAFSRNVRMLLESNPDKKLSDYTTLQLEGYISAWSFQSEDTYIPHRIIVKRNITDLKI